MDTFLLDWSMATSKFLSIDDRSMKGTDHSRCYCDDAPQNYGGPAADGTAGCNMPCQGNNAELCGGPGRLNVYQFLRIPRIPQALRHLQIRQASTRLRFFPSHIKAVTPITWPPAER
jgi:hypothetical protein